MEINGIKLTDEELKNTCKRCGEYNKELDNEGVCKYCRWEEDNRNSFQDDFD